jgi:hypothetical protein
VKTIVRSVLGLVLVLGWWTFTGNSISTHKAQDKIPASVWGGGAGKLEIEAESSTPARMMVSFSRDAKDIEDNLETYEDVPAGTFRWAIDVPSGTGGYIELNAMEPKAGDHLKFRILANGRQVFEDEDRLDQPLEPGYAFFVQAYFDDYARGKLSHD